MKAYLIVTAEYPIHRPTLMPREITDFDPAAYLDDDEAIAAYLSDAFETQDVAFINNSIVVVARAKGMTQIAQEAGVNPT